MPDDTFDTDECLKRLEERVARLEAGQQRSYSIIASAWLHKEQSFKKDLTFYECRHYFKKFMQELGRFETSENHRAYTDWEVEAVFGPDGDCTEEFERWYAQNTPPDTYIPPHWREKYRKEINA
jgi:hypothetical protein